MFFICLKLLHSSTITVSISPIQSYISTDVINLNIEQTYKTTTKVVHTEKIYDPKNYTSKSSGISSNTLAPILCLKLEFNIRKEFPPAYLRDILTVLLPYVTFDENPEIYFNINDENDFFKNRIDAGEGFSALVNTSSMCYSSMKKLTDRISSTTNSKEFTLFFNGEKIFSNKKKTLPLNVYTQINYNKNFNEQAIQIVVYYKRMYFFKTVHELILDVDGSGALYEKLTSGSDSETFENIPPCADIIIVFYTTGLYKLLFDQNLLNYIQEKHFFKIDKGEQKHIYIFIHDYEKSSGEYLKMKKDIIEKLFNENTVIFIQNQQVYPSIE